MMIPNYDAQTNEPVHNGKCSKIQPCNREPLDTYTSRIIQGAKEINGAPYTHTNIMMNETYILGFGNTYAFTNQSIDLQGVIPEVWGDEQNTSHLITL